MSAMTPECPVCEPLLAWTVVRGPGPILARIQQMLALVGKGFTELRADARNGLTKIWSELPPDAVTHHLVTNGPGPTGPHTVPSAITLRCDRCGRTFAQRWTYERGAESWTVNPA